MGEIFGDALPQLHPIGESIIRKPGMKGKLFSKTRYQGKGAMPSMQRITERGGSGFEDRLIFE